MKPCLKPWLVFTGGWLPTSRKNAPQFRNILASDELSCISQQTMDSSHGFKVVHHFVYAQQGIQACWIWEIKRKPSTWRNWSLLRHTQKGIAEAQGLRHSVKRVPSAKTGRPESSPFCTCCAVVLSEKPNKLEKSKHELNKQNTRRVSCPNLGEGIVLLPWCFFEFALNGKSVENVEKNKKENNKTMSAVLP